MTKFVVIKKKKIVVILFFYRILKLIITRCDAISIKFSLFELFI